MTARRTAVALALTCLLLFVTPAGAALPKLSVAKKVTLPKGATGIAEGYLPALSCPSVGNCVAGGADLSAKVEGVLLSERHGVWVAPTTLKAPTNAAADPNITIYAVSCGEANDCAATGSYVTVSANTEPFVVAEINGVWQRAVQLLLPPGALESGQFADARSIACVGVDDCSAAGSYLDSNEPVSRNEAFVVKEVKGAWWQAVEVVLPATANANPFASLVQLACASAYNCTAVGGYIDENNVDQTLVVREVNEVFQPGETLTLPANTSAYAGASLSEVTCLHHGACTVLGTYNDLSGHVQPLVDTSAGATWPRASEVVMPATANPSTFFYGFSGLACASAGNCALGGQYRGASGIYQGFLDNEKNGVWENATTLALPSGASEVGHNGGVITVSCPRAGDCLAGAAYVDAAGNYQALTVRESKDVWARGVKVHLPGAATTVGTDGGLYALECPSATSCTATGSYLAHGTTYEGFTLVG